MAGVIVVWFAYATWPIPWYGYFAIVCVYFFAAFFAYFFAFLLPACIRTLPYACELQRRHALFSFPREVRKAKALLKGANPPDWVIIVHSDGCGWRLERLSLTECPLRGQREHDSGPQFGTLRDPQYNPLDYLVRWERPLEVEECRSALEMLRSVDMKRIVDVESRTSSLHYSGIAVLRRDPPLVCAAKFYPMAYAFDPQTRGHPTFRLASLVIKLPEILEG